MPFKKLIATNKEINWGNKDITFKARSILWASRGGENQRFTSSGVYHAYSNGTLRTFPTVTVTGSADGLTLSLNGEILTFGDFSNTTIIKDEIKMRAEGFIIQPGNNEISVDGTNYDITMSIEFRDRFI